MVVRCWVWRVWGLGGCWVGLGWVCLVVWVSWLGGLVGVVCRVWCLWIVLRLVWVVRVVFVVGCWVWCGVGLGMSGLWGVGWCL